MKTKIKFLFTIAIMIIALTAISCSNSKKKTNESTQTHQHEVTQYTCSMHPEVIEDKPGNCPKCGMELIVKETDEHEGHEHGKEEHEHNH
jgi:uncharacterized paraquat-inducible protein A